MRRRVGHVHLTPLRPARLVARQQRAALASPLPKIAEALVDDLPGVHRRQDHPPVNNHRGQQIVVAHTGVGVHILEARPGGLGARSRGRRPRQDHDAIPLIDPHHLVVLGPAVHRWQEIRDALLLILAHPVVIGRKRRQHGRSPIALRDAVEHRSSGPYGTQRGRESVNRASHRTSAVAASRATITDDAPSLKPT